MTTSEIKHFLEIPYDKLEELNLEAKTKVAGRASADELREHYIRYLTDEKRLKAVTVCFSDLEGRFHMLDYDKRFLLKSYDNLTFDGSSIRGFSQVRESDLRLEIDWGSFRWLPSDVFGPGKVLVFGLIKDRDRASYPADMRGQLKALTDELLARDGMVANISVECEGFLFEGVNAEQNYLAARLQAGVQRRLLQFAAEGRPEAVHRRFGRGATGVGLRKREGPSGSRPFAVRVELPVLRRSAGRGPIAAVQTHGPADGRQHGDDGQLPAQADQRHQRQRHALQPVVVPGRQEPVSPAQRRRRTVPAGVELHRSLAEQRGRHLLDPQLQRERLSAAGSALRGPEPDQGLGGRSHFHGADPAGQRADGPHRDAGRRAGRQSLPVFLRAVADRPERAVEQGTHLRAAEDASRFLPGNIYDAIELFQASPFVTQMLGPRTQERFVERKLAVAHRSPRELGTVVKTTEVRFHHEVTNQFLWSQF